jgi:tetratricopeptide (TPR) repeat protein
MPRTRVIEIDDAQALGTRLRAARAERQMSLRDLAFPGCTAPYISAIEHGRRTPSLQILNALAERLGVTPTFLATGATATDQELLDDAELALRLGEPKQAEALFEKVASSSSGTTKMRALGGLGLCALNDGNLLDGIQLLEGARSLDGDAFLHNISLVEALGRSYADHGEYESAAALFSAARDRAEERSEPAAALKLTVLLANTYIDLGDLGHSIETLGEALNEAVELKDARARATVYWTQARLHTIEGRHDVAAEFAGRALETLRVDEDERAIAFALQTLAYIELERDNAEQALELLEEAAPTIRRTATTIERAVFDLERGRALASLGRNDEAQALLQEIGPVLSGDQRSNSGRYLVVLGELYEKLGRDDDALAMYEAAVDLLEGPRSPHLARGFQLIASLLERQGKPTEALAALRRAFELNNAAAQRTTAS